MILRFIFAFICSIFFAVFLTYFFKRRGPGPFDGILYFFAIIFCFTLAMGVWLNPIGPMYRGVPWLGVIGTALLIALLIAELVPHSDKGKYIKKTKREIQLEEEKDEEILQKEFSILIVIIVIILIGAYIYALGNKLPEVTTGF